MNCDYAYAKLQSINGVEHSVKNFPLLLVKKASSRQGLPRELELSSLETLQLTKCLQEPTLIGLLSYDYEQEKFFLINGSKMQVDEALYDPSPVFEEALRFLAKDKQTARQKLFRHFKQNTILLNDLAKIHLHCLRCEMPHVYFFVLPRGPADKNEDFSIKLCGASQLLNQQKNYLNPRNKIPDMELSQRWTYEEKEILKRGVLAFGYGRWDKLKRERLRSKERKEVIAFANAFLRCLVDNLRQECDELQNFLLGIIEEQADDLYVAPSNKDWEIVGQSARAVPWARRIQLLFRIRVLIKKFKKKQQQEQMQVNWSTLLNFIPDQVLMGQRPSVWWSRQHDIDLLRGIYKFGYANYTEIRDCADYSFYQHEQNNIYNDFPSSDNSTRRLKKLMAAIMRIENEKGRLNFEMEQQPDNQLEGWNQKEVRLLFSFMNNYGIPINNDAKANWLELKERFQAYAAAHHLEINKPQSQIEKIVCFIRSKCNQIIHQKQHKAKDEDKKEEEVLEISYEEAFNFTRSTNVLHLIRKSHINREELVQKYAEQLKTHNEEQLQKRPGWSVFGPSTYDLLLMDERLLRCITQNGLDCYTPLCIQHPSFQQYGSELVSQRVAFLVEFFRLMIQLNNIKQKKVYSSKNMLNEDGTKKKVKVEIKRDENGEVVLPIQINNSLRLIHTGVVSTNPNYHSEHNLFPIGFKSVRLYNSIFKKGVKCEYLNEILEGPDNKPLYRVTCSEDPLNPIIKDSSTGCWVNICQKVNQLQDHKKQKVTISGTERFGLLEPNINKLLEDLPNSDMCFKYTFKYRNSVQP